MAGRPSKVGLDYFDLDCHMDEKVELIEAEFGLKGFAIIVKLYQSIYSGLGYYCEWTPEISVLWAYRLGCSRSAEFGDVGSSYAEGELSGFPKNLINEVIAASIRRNLFSKQLFNKYHILTSSGIQKRYLSATSKRGYVELKKEYLLISVGKNTKNVVINSINDGINANSEAENPQSRVEKSRVDNKNIMCKADALALFEELWKVYPSKKGKGQVSDAKKMQLLKVGREEMIRAIERYKIELEKDKDWRKPQNGSTFFNSGYVDYLDTNYSPDKRAAGRPANGFHNFKEREYDFEELQNQLINK